MSKIFPTLMLYKLWEDGKIGSLDDPLEKYVENFTIKNPLGKTRDSQLKYVTDGLIFLDSGEVQIRSSSVTLRRMASQLSGACRGGGGLRTAIPKRVPTEIGRLLPNQKSCLEFHSNPLPALISVSDEYLKARRMTYKLFQVLFPASVEGIKGKRINDPLTNCQSISHTSSTFFRDILRREWRVLELYIMSQLLCVDSGLPRRLRATNLLWKGKTQSAINLLQDDVLIADPGTK